MAAVVPARASSLAVVASSPSVAAAVSTTDAHAATSSGTANLQSAVSSHSSATSLSPGGVNPPRESTFPPAAAVMVNGDSSLGAISMHPPSQALLPLLDVGVAEVCT